MENYANFVDKQLNLLYYNSFINENYDSLEFCFN